MATQTRRGDNQKLKMLYLVKILTEESDDAHPLTMAEIIAKLASYGVNANRKTPCTKTLKNCDTLVLI